MSTWFQHAGDLAQALIGVGKKDDTEYRDRRVEAAIGQAERRAIHAIGAHAAGDSRRIARALDDARHHVRGGVDCHDMDAASSGEEGGTTGAGTDIDQSIAAAQAKPVERPARKGVRERLEHLLVHRNVIVPALGFLVRLKLHR